MPQIDLALGTEEIERVENTMALKQKTEAHVAAVHVAGADSSVSFGSRGVHALG